MTPADYARAFARNCPRPALTREELAELTRLFVVAIGEAGSRLPPAAVRELEAQAEDRLARGFAAAVRRGLPRG